MKESTRNSSMNQSMREKKLAREKKREERELKRMQEAAHKKVDTEHQTKPIVPVSMPSSSSTGGGRGGWTTETSVSNWTASTRKNEAIPSPDTPSNASEPKKLSFGLKKTSFQFGLKKK